MRTTEIVPFRLFQMPCCGFLCCWVNPRLPSYCPECGKMVLMKLRTGECTREQADATLSMSGDAPLTKIVYGEIPHGGTG